MKTFRIFYRVPATTEHKSYLSETTVEANDKADAIRRFQMAHTDYYITSVFNGI